jgi:hypothetical protein
VEVEARGVLFSEEVVLVVEDIVLGLVFENFREYESMVF